MTRKTHGSHGLGMALAFALALVGLIPAQALAVDPEDAVGGAGSKWASGQFLHQSGNNCDILGESKSETMVSAIAGYGGAPNQGIAKVGDRYYASVLVSIPGNPCGSGSSSVATDLVLPRGTSVDTSAPIRCFGQPRNATTFGELTGGSWSFQGSSGPWCPAQVGGSLTGTPGAVGVGFRPLASGQLYWLFVPIKSTQVLEGGSVSPPDEIRWVLRTSATYEGQGSASVWTHVVPTGNGNNPFIYFARNPSVEPFWLNTPPATDPPDSHNRAEWFANLYSAGKAGTLCWDLYAGATATGTPVRNCSDPFADWDPTVTSPADLWQVYGDGPNGGYAPYAYGLSETYTIRWSFDPTQAGIPTVTKDITFTTLAGPDPDGDGVPNNGTDACPTVKGTQADGCQPPVQTDPDGDGFFGSSDACPDANGAASVDGCPPAGGGDGGGGGGGGETPPDLIAPVLGVGSVKGKLGAGLAKGLLVKFTCSEVCKYTGRLKLARRTAKKLGLAARPVVIARGSTQLTAAGPGKARIRFTSKARSRLKRVRRLRVTLVSKAGDPAGNTSAPAKRTLTLRR